MKKIGDLRLGWLQAFVAVAEHGKQTAAATALGRDQSLVSRDLDSLAQWLGGAVLHDSGVPTRLYPAGERFLPVAQEVIRLLEEARAPYAQALEANHSVTSSDA